MTLSLSFRRPVEDDLDLPGVLGGLVDGGLDVEPVLGPGRHHVPQALESLAHQGLSQRPLQRVVLVAPLQGHLHRRLSARDPAHTQPSGVVAGVADRRSPAGADPLCAAVVGFGLLLETLLEIIQKLFGGKLLERLLVHPQQARQLPGVLQPGVQHGPRHLVELDALGVRHLSAFEVMGENLVEEVEVALALDEDRAGRRVEVLEGIHQTPGHGPVEREKCGGADGQPHPAQFIEEVDEQGRKMFGCLGVWQNDKKTESQNNGSAATSAYRRLLLTASRARWWSWLFLNSTPR